jgi:hypothetical protein
VAGAMQSRRKSQTNRSIAGVEEQEKEQEHTQEKIVNEGKSNSLVTFLLSFTIYPPTDLHKFDHPG